MMPPRSRTDPLLETHLRDLENATRRFVENVDAGQLHAAEIRTQAENIRILAQHTLKQLTRHLKEGKFLG